MCLQAKILAAMCNDLLSTAPIRSEIDRRELNGQLNAGLGGEGGAMPMRTQEERSQRQLTVSFILVQTDFAVFVMTLASQTPRCHGIRDSRAQHSTSCNQS